MKYFIEIKKKSIRNTDISLEILLQYDTLSIFVLSRDKIVELININCQLLIFLQKKILIMQYVNINNPIIK